jgi:hypothetical protein
MLRPGERVMRVVIVLVRGAMLSGIYLTVFVVRVSRDISARYV